ncbi:plexin domain-containing protein 2-like [Lampetra fluviatilis]
MGANLLPSPLLLLQLLLLLLQLTSPACGVAYRDVPTQGLAFVAVGAARQGASRSARDVSPLPNAASASQPLSTGVNDVDDDNDDPWGGESQDGADNGTAHFEDNHSYYTSRTYRLADPRGRELWVNIDKMQNQHVRVHGILSNTHRQAARVNLSFPFLFYGHHLEEVTIATGGFIYTGEVIHRMLTATQYIAPLMANFDPSISKESTVRYFDNGTALVVQWDRVHLHDNPGAGSFTFQAALHSDGRIVFAYKDIPVPVTRIKGDNHPVKVGLSDAFMVVESLGALPILRRRTIYEYHRVELEVVKVTNLTVIEMAPLPTCLQYTSCKGCLTAQTSFNCSWCGHLQRCSSGFDRHRQDWIDNGCLQELREEQCEEEEAAGGAAGNSSDVSPSGPSARQSTQPSSTAVSTANTATTSFGPRDEGSMSLHLKKSAMESYSHSPSLYVGSVLGSLLAVLILTALSLIVLYVYRHPTSPVGLFIIEHRPSRWPSMRFRRGSGHPSYAEVESVSLEKDCFVES